MPKKNSNEHPEECSEMRPALTQEGRENQLVSLAIDMAEEQLRERTASSQVLVHFLKLGTTKAELEKEKIKQENLLLQAKADAIRDADEIKSLYAEAIDAMRMYSGNGEDCDYKDLY